MKKKILSLIVLALSCVMIGGLISCEEEIKPPGWETSYSLPYEDIDTIRIVFGEDCIYPSRTKAEEFYHVSSIQGDNIWHYWGKAVYIPTLVAASWNENYYGIKFHVSLEKRNNDVSDQRYLEEHEKLDKNNIILYRKTHLDYKQYYYHYNSFLYRFNFYNKVPLGFADAIIFDYVKSMK